MTATDLKAKAIETAPEYYHTYINKVGDQPLAEMLEDGGIDLFVDDFETIKKIGLKTYAPGKWTVNELIQHLIDTERIFMNRALRFLRLDKTELPGYDHDAYGPISGANNKSVEDLLTEYRILRLSSYYFFRNLSEEELLRTGIASGLEISVLAIGYILIGHPMHHFGVIKERYFSLAD